MKLDFSAFAVFDADSLFKTVSVVVTREGVFKLINLSIVAFPSEVDGKFGSLLGKT